MHERFPSDERVQQEQTYPSISSVLQAENNLTSIELRIERKEYRSYSSSVPVFPLDPLHRGCPMLSKLNIDLDEFKGYSTGWDWYFREERRSRRFPMRPPHSAAALSTLAQFANLNHLTAHFLIDQNELEFVHPRQERQAAFDLYKNIQTQKCGARLDRLDFVFHVCSFENSHGMIHEVRDVKPPITTFVRPLQVPKRDIKYSVICDDARSTKVRHHQKIVGKPSGQIPPLDHMGLEINQSKASPSCRSLVDNIAKIAPLSSLLNKDADKGKGKWPFEVDMLEYE